MCGGKGYGVRVCVGGARAKGTGCECVCWGWGWGDSAEEGCRAKALFKSNNARLSAVIWKKISSLLRHTSTKMAPSWGGVRVGFEDRGTALT